MTYYKDFNNAEFLDDCVLLTYADYKSSANNLKENVLNIAKQITDETASCIIYVAYYFKMKSDGPMSRFNTN